MNSVAEQWHGPLTAVPNYLLYLNQYLDRDDRVSSTGMAVLLHLVADWDEDWPSISKAAIARRLGLSARQVQRALTELENKELIARVVQRDRKRGRLANSYDLSKLIALLQMIAAEHPVPARTHRPAAAPPPVNPQPVAEPPRDSLWSRIKKRLLPSKPTAAEYKAMIATAQRYPALCSDWELQFLRNTRYYRRPFSKRQITVIEELYARALAESEEKR